MLYIYYYYSIIACLEFNVQDKCICVFVCIADNGDYFDRLLLALVSLLFILCVPLLYMSQRLISCQISVIISVRCCV